MTVFHGGADWLDDRPARVPRRSLLLRARDIAGVALVASATVSLTLLAWAVLS